MMSLFVLIAFDNPDVVVYTLSPNILRRYHKKRTAERLKTVHLSFEERTIFSMKLRLYFIIYFVLLL